MSAFWVERVMKNTSNPKKGFESYFSLSEKPPSLELMSRTYKILR